MIDFKAGMPAKGKMKLSEQAFQDILWWKFNWKSIIRSRDHEVFAAVMFENNGFVLGLGDKTM